MTDIKTLVSVKALEWKNVAVDGGFPRFQATTPFGQTREIFVSWWGKEGKWGYVYTATDEGPYFHTADEAKAAAQADYESRVLSSLSPSREAGEVDIADDNDGKEQDAFEAWAISARYDMHQHPLHWLFLDKRTAAARDGWRAGIRYARDRALASPPASSSEVSTLKAEVERMRKASEWQPIETAPKDGTEVIVGGCKSEPSVRTAHWGAGRFNRKTKSYDRDWADGATFGFGPTHWMPFPAPPALHEVEEG